MNGINNYGNNFVVYYGGNMNIVEVKKAYEKWLDNFCHHQNYRIDEDMRELDILVNRRDYGWCVRQYTGHAYRPKTCVANGHRHNIAFVSEVVQW